MEDEYGNKIVACIDLSCLNKYDILCIQKNAKTVLNRRQTLCIANKPMV